MRLVSQILDDRRELVARPTPTVAAEDSFRSCRVSLDKQMRYALCVEVDHGDAVFGACHCCECLCNHVGDLSIGRSAGNMTLSIDPPFDLRLGKRQHVLRMHGRRGGHCLVLSDARLMSCTALRR